MSKYHTSQRSNLCLVLKTIAFVPMLNNLTELSTLGFFFLLVSKAKAMVKLLSASEAGKGKF